MALVIVLLTRFNVIQQLARFAPLKHRMIMGLMFFNQEYGWKRIHLKGKQIKLNSSLIRHLEQSENSLLVKSLSNNKLHWGPVNSSLMSFLILFHYREATLLILPLLSLTIVIISIWELCSIAILYLFHRHCLLIWKGVTPCFGLFLVLIIVQIVVSMVKSFQLLSDSLDI